MRFSKNIIVAILLVSVLAGTIWAPTTQAESIDLRSVGTAGAVAANASTDRSACTFTGGSWDGIGFANCITGMVYIFTVGLGTAVAYVGASFLNLAAHLSLNSGAYAMDFVASGWTTARDIANMAFIFILIYLAVTIMFQAQTAHSMQTLAGVIVIALIINFSFFFTRLVIDAGNILSVQFYNAVVSLSEGATVLNTGIPDITVSIMKGINLQSALGSDSFKQFANDNNTAQGFIPYVIALSFVFIAAGVMLFMLAATFLAAGIKFLMRIVVLWFMIIASPLALIARVSGIHSLEHYYKEWQDNLIKHAFYPVAFLFVFWVLAQFMSGLGDDIGGIGSMFGDLNQHGPVTDLGTFIASIGALIANIAIRLGFIIAMLYIGLRAADRMGVVGATAAKNFGNTVAFGWTGGILRHTLGRGSSLAMGVIPDKGIGRVARAPLNFVANRSFDARTTASRIPGAKDFIEKTYGKSAGKGGYNEYLHHKESEVKKKGDEIVKKVEGHGMGPKAEQKEQKKYEAEYNNKNGPNSFNSKITELIHTIEAAEKEQVNLTQKGFESMDAAQRKQYDIEVKANKDSIKNSQKQLQALKGVGQRIIAAKDKEHKQEIAIKLMASGNTAKYLAGKKILLGKSNKDKLAEAAKAVTDEEKDSEGDGHAKEDKGGSGGGASSTHDTSHSTQANDNHGAAHH